MGNKNFKRDLKYHRTNILKFILKAKFIRFYFCFWFWKIFYFIILIFLSLNICFYFIFYLFFIFCDNILSFNSGFRLLKIKFKTNLFVGIKGNENHKKKKRKEKKKLENPKNVSE